MLIHMLLCEQMVFIKMYAYFQPYLDDSDDILAEVRNVISPYAAVYCHAQ